MYSSGLKGGREEKTEGKELWQQNKTHTITYNNKIDTDKIMFTPFCALLRRVLEKSIRSILKTIESTLALVI